MKFAPFAYAALLLPLLTVNAQTPSEYDTLYARCVKQAGQINNTIVHTCSSTVSEKAKAEINRRYRSIYAKLESKNPDDAKKFEESQKAWLVYRNSHCDLAGAYIGSPMWDYCPMTLNSARALELRELDGG
jgi:uncharacterized protein YecT (DUF1311 family)